MLFFNLGTHLVIVGVNSEYLILQSSSLTPTDFVIEKQSRSIILALVVPHFFILCELIFLFPSQTISTSPSLSLFLLSSVSLSPACLSFFSPFPFLDIRPLFYFARCSRLFYTSCPLPLPLSTPPTPFQLFFTLPPVCPPFLVQLQFSFSSKKA